MIYIYFIQDMQATELKSGKETSEDTKQCLQFVLNALTFALNKEKISPSYNLKITAACLECVYLLVLSKNVPFDMDFFMSYGAIGNTRIIVQKSWSCLVSLMLSNLKVFLNLG